MWGLSNAFSMSTDTMCIYWSFSLYVFCRNFIATTCTRFIEDLPLLNTKWMLPNSTTDLNLWFIIRSNSFTMWEVATLHYETFSFKQ